MNSIDLHVMIVSVQYETETGMGVGILFVREKVVRMNQLNYGIPGSRAELAVFLFRMLEAATVDQMFVSRSVFRSGHVYR